MDYDKLIHYLKCCARVDAQNTGCDDCDLEYCGEECQQLCRTAATAIETIRAEKEKLREERDEARVDCAVAEKNHADCIADLARVTAERDKAVEEMGHLKAVMRDKGIVVIPPKYPWGRSEWNM